MELEGEAAVVFIVRWGDKWDLLFNAQCDVDHTWDFFFPSFLTKIIYYLNPKKKKKKTYIGGEMMQHFSNLIN